MNGDNFDFEMPHPNLQCRIRGCHNLATHVIAFNDGDREDWYTCSPCHNSLAEACAEQEAIEIIRRMKAANV